MRIVHIITRLIIGGAQENTLLSCEGQHDHGHDVTLITGPAIGPEGSLLDRAQKYGYRVCVVDEMRRSIHPRRDYKTFNHLVHLLRQLKPDLVHTHSSKAGIIGRWAARQAGVPFVVHTIHGLAFTAGKSRLSNGVYKWLERRTAPLTDRIVCVADAMREQSLACGIGTPEQYTTIYSGIQTGPFVESGAQRESTRHKLGIAPDDIVVGTIARLFDLKGHEDLLACAPRLCSEFPRLRFLWVGDGTRRGEFERCMDKMNLRDRFILTGMVPPMDVPMYTAAMDMLVHPSRREGLARALPQAALAAKPVITYDVDGNREGLIDGQSGFVVPAFDLDRLEQSIQVLAADASLRNTMGLVGQKFARARFGADVMVAALESLYGSLSLNRSTSGV